MLVTVMTAGIVPEYSVVRYYVNGDAARVGYLIHGNLGIALIDPLSGDALGIGVTDFVELLATPAATACFYIANKESP